MASGVAGLLERDFIKGNLLDVQDELERRIRVLEETQFAPAMPWFDARLYGAIGDNTTDDAAAINAALADAGAYPGSSVVLPRTTSGIYRIGTPLYVPHLVTLRADLGVQIRLTAGFTGFGVIVAKDWQNNVTANYGGIRLINIEIIGSAALGSYHGVVTLGQNSMVFQCMIREVNGDGVLITNKTRNGSRITPGVNFNRQMVSHCRVHTCTGSGVKLDGPTDCYVLFNHINECDEHGIGTSADADDGTIGGGGMQIVGNHISACGKDGIRIGTAGTGTIINGNNIEDFGLSATQGSYHGIALINAQTYGIVVANNSIWTAEGGHASNVHRMIGISSGGDGNVQIIVANNFGRGNLTAIPMYVVLATGGTSINLQCSNNHMHRVVDPVFNTDFIRGNENSWDYANAAPTAGTWRQGMRVWDDTPAAAGVPGWICTAGGTPGTWKAMAALAA